MTNKPPPADVFFKWMVTKKFQTKTLQVAFFNTKEGIIVAYLNLN